MTEPKNTSVVGFLNAANNKFSFAEELQNLKVAGLYTISEIARINRRPTRTIERWLAGKMEPCDDLKASVLKELIAAAPSAKMQRKAFNRHNLTWDQAKHRWILRFTVANDDPKKVGDRYDIKLRTADLTAAIVAREAVMDMLKKLEKPAIVRLQKRKA